MLFVFLVTMSDLSDEEAGKTSKAGSESEAGKTSKAGSETEAESEVEFEERFCGRRNLGFELCD